MADSTSSQQRYLQELEAGLDGGGPVSGRVEQVGAHALIEAIERRGQDRRMTVWFERVSIEVEFRGGALQSIEFSSPDADPCSGPAALEQLAALEEAVFEIQPPTGGPGGPDGAASARSADGAAGRGAPLRGALIFVVVLLIGAGIFFAARHLAFDSGGAHGAAPALVPAAQRGDAGPAGEVSATELRQLEEALHRNAARFMLPTEGPEPRGGDETAGAADAPAAGDGNGEPAD